MAEVSVILPVYNGEAFLEECLKSVLNQDCQDWVLLAVNDGSTDRTGEILRMYASMDQRIQVYDKSNSGLTDSLRFGVAQAVTKYLTFLDADDSYKSDMLSSLLKRIRETDADCVRGGYVKRRGNEERIELFVCDGVFDRASIQGQILKPFFEEDANLYRHWSTARWDKIYRTELVRRVYDKYQMNLSLGEDVLFALCYLFECSRIVNLDHSYCYEYRILEDSMSRGFNEKLYQNYQSYITRIEQLCRENGYEGWAIPAFEDNCTLNMLYELRHTAQMPADEAGRWKKKLKAQLHDRRQLYKLVLKEDFPFKQQLLKLRSRLK